MAEGTQALATQLDLIEWAQGNGDWWSEWFWSSFSSKVGDPRSVRKVLESIGEAETVFVSKEMCAVIEKAARELPDIPLQRENMFWDRAFIYFERPIQLEYPIGEDQEAGRMRGLYFMRNERILQAESAEELEWSKETRPENLEYKPGIIHMTFIDVDTLPELQEMNVGIRTFPFDLSGWTYGKRWETVPMGKSKWGEKVDVSLSQQRKLLLATNLIASQYVALVSGRQAGRQQRRRAARMDMPNYGDITYVTLRRASTPNADRDVDPDFEYSHRFVVSGHWRHQYYPSKGEHSLIWIDPFIKGPEDKPLIIKDKVWKLVR